MTELWQSICLAVGTLLFVFGHTANAASVEIDFSQQVRPILAEHCLHCHGPDEDSVEGGLRLDLEELAKESAIVAYSPDESELIHRLESTDPDQRMPPAKTGKSLSAKEIETLRQWISEGAKYQQHWSLRPITDPAVPEIEQGVQSDVDRFIVSQLTAKGLNLAPPASKRQLIRRATFDLTGLPPTYAEVERFVNDQDPNAFANAIDRLLDSPAYGERWGRHWLDLARYADTHGGAAIGFTRFPFSYTYRDYVIQALNRDLPYDRFIVEQLAADQLGLEPSDPALAGLGFLTVGMQFRNRHDIIDDQIDVISRGLLGLTVACARCHDHKYDPVSTKDYYSLYATLASSRTPDQLPLIGNPPTDEAYAQYADQLQRFERAAGDMARDQTAVMRSRLRMQVGLYLRELAKGTPEQDLSAAFLSFRTDDVRPQILNHWRNYLASMPSNDPVFGLWKQLEQIPTEQFAKQCLSLCEQMKLENGDEAQFNEPHGFGTPTPRWNPVVLKTVLEKQPASLLELADCYGSVFANVNRRWLQALTEATLEAAVDGEIYTDEDPRHAEINSAVYQQLRYHLFSDGTPTVMSEELSITQLNRTVRDTLSGKQGAVHNLHLSSPGSPPRAMTLEEDEAAGPFQVFRRGNPLDRGEIVSANFLTVLRQQEQAFPAGKRRLALAQRIIDPTNPLTRRVIVNWVWQHHFGQGLVNTPDDFGTRGDSPSHPELLDYLASRLIDDGWSLKQLHRRIMLSDVYQQASVENEAARQIDPDNRLVWRMPKQRLDMESMRDAMLFASAELQRDFGGRPFDFLSQPTVPRRSVYGFINRDIVTTIASTFDVANPNSCTVKRPDTSVPQQTLFALNSAFIQDRALQFAKLAEAEVPSGTLERIRWMYHKAFARDPREEELNRVMMFLATAPNPDLGSEIAPERWQQFAHVLLASNEFLFVD